MEHLWKAFAISLVVTLLLGPLIIPLLRGLKFGQNIRSDGPSRHMSKAGTPTMGGVMFLAGTVVGGILLGRGQQDSIA
ncbi:MAG: phospho-N-acetylmuramoyl-pentapeptide-transferase, partial [Desulfotomaculaceae bacterium]